MWLGLGLILVSRLFVFAGEAPGPVLLLAQKAEAKKKAAAKKAITPGDASAAPAPTGASDSGLKFSRDIAPILVGNCIGCHNPERRRGKFDLTTFEKLMAGSDVEKVIVPGKPEESHLVLRLRGEETPKMPQGNNNNLSDEAIARIERWVKLGARLDAGIDPKAILNTYAPTAEDLRAAELRKLPQEERDRKVEAVARQRWKQASPKTIPETTSSAHFLLFSTMPKDRATSVTKSLETAYGQLRTLLSRPGTSALDWPEKTSAFVFNDAASFVEFVRTLENREVEATETGTANFGVREPYLAVIDPLGGQADPSLGAAARKASKSRRGEEGTAVERNVPGLLAEQMALGVLKGEKSAPGWLSQGVGAYFAAALDPKSAYVHRLRSTALEQCQRGWTSRANDALGGQLAGNETRAVGYAVVDWMAHDPQARTRFSSFVRGMIDEGPTRLDEVLQTVFNVRRQDLYTASEAWVLSHYGRAR
jgi:mono/diheme cytochrome c family protein